MRYVVIVGQTKDEALRLIEEAIELHPESLREEGLTPPDQCVGEDSVGGKSPQETR